MSVTGNGTTSKASITPPGESRRRAEPSSRRGQEVPDGRCDFVAVRLESEVSGLEERDSVAPDGEQRRLVLAKVLLELRIHVDVARVVEEQVQLYLMRAGSGHVVVFQVVAIRRDQGRVVDSGCVLPVRRLGSQQSAQRIPVVL